jgi:hypothetical protein
MKLFVLKLLGRVVYRLFKCTGMTQMKNFVLVQYLTTWRVHLEAWRDPRPTLRLHSTFSSSSNHPWKMRLQTSIGFLPPFCLGHVELISIGATRHWCHPTGLGERRRTRGLGAHLVNGCCGVGGVEAKRQDLHCAHSACM